MLHMKAVILNKKICPRLFDLMQNVYVLCVVPDDKLLQFMFFSLKLNV